jgi:hypothetical protein
MKLLARIKRAQAQERSAQVGVRGGPNVIHVRHRRVIELAGIAVPALLAPLPADCDRLPAVLTRGAEKPAP